jgi:hypothetical protein
MDLVDRFRRCRIPTTRSDLDTFEHECDGDKTPARPWRSGFLARYTCEQLHEHAEKASAILDRPKSHLRHCIANFSYCGM